MPIGIERLTDRERQVLTLVADFRTNAEIAAKLSLSEHTVHAHIARILRKLQVRSRREASRLFREQASRRSAD